MLLDLNSLQIYCDLVESGSFSRTAERHFVTQSAVSQKLRSLENAVGHVLIERGRGKSRFVLTEAGRILLHGALPLLRQADELAASLSGLSDEVAGTVRVATVYSVGLHALPGRL